MKTTGKMIIPAMVFSFALMAFCAIAADAQDRVEQRLAKQQQKAGNLKNAASQQRASNMIDKVTKEEFEMKTKHHGKLTRRDERKLNRLMNENARIMNNSAKKTKKQQ